MSGLNALVGGNEFHPDCEMMDCTLLARIAGKPTVGVLPTAAAHERPDLAAENGIRKLFSQKKCF
jgi:hypothetical protein